MGWSSTAPRERGGGDAKARGDGSLGSRKGIGKPAGAGGTGLSGAAACRRPLPLSPGLRGGAAGRARGRGRGWGGGSRKPHPGSAPAPLTHGAAISPARPGPARRGPGMSGTWAAPPRRCAGGCSGGCPGGGGCRCRCCSRCCCCRPPHRYGRAAARGWEGAGARACPCPARERGWELPAEWEGAGARALRGSAGGRVSRGWGGGGAGTRGCASPACVTVRARESVSAQAPAPRSAPRARVSAPTRGAVRGSRVLLVTAGGGAGSGTRASVVWGAKGLRRPPHVGGAGGGRAMEIHAG